MWVSAPYCRTARPPRPEAAAQAEVEGKRLLSQKGAPIVTHSSQVGRVRHSAHFYTTRSLPRSSTYPSFAAARSRVPASHSQPFSRAQRSTSP